MRPIRPLRQGASAAAKRFPPESSVTAFDRDNSSSVEQAAPIVSKRANPVRRKGQAFTSRVLHVGCGVASPARLHAFFQSGGWQEIRLDIDATTKPDITASVVDMQRWVEDQSCDAVWSSHVLEHLSRHEVSRSLREFQRVLTPNGFGLMRCPDLEIVAQLIVDGKIDQVLYNSAAGPITPLDMLYGHGASIARGQNHMRHGTGFTQDLLARDLLNAGFAEVRAVRTETYEIWAAAFMPSADISGIVDKLAEHGLDLRD